MIRVAINGYGNLGRGAEQAITKNKDMELVGLLRIDLRRLRPGQVTHEFSFHDSGPVPERSATERPDHDHVMTSCCRCLRQVLSTTRIGTCEA